MNDSERVTPPPPWAPLAAVLGRRWRAAPLSGREARQELPRADAAVVLGARVFADGSPSRTLRERVAVASQLVLSGQAPLLVVSGGPGDGPVHETSAMLELAVALGVARSEVVIDTTGVSTRATCQALRRLAEQRGWARLLVVTSDWHLPRALFGFERLGLSVCGVPSRSALRPGKLAWLLAREMAACLELRWIA